MKMISADRLLEDLRKVYEKAGWAPWECHFSLLDMERNIDGQYGMERVTISTSEIVSKDKLAFIPENVIAEFVYDGFVMKLGKKVMALAKMKEDDVPLLKGKVYSASIDVLQHTLPLNIHDCDLGSALFEENQK